jgi:hypothetical protein
MPNPNNPLPPFPSPQPGEQLAQLDSANETAIAQFLYTAGPVPMPPPPSNVWRAGQHFSYAVSKTLFHDSGLRCSPVCGPVGTPMSVTRETAPWGKMAVRWRAARNNGPPVIPSVDLGDPNVVLEKSWITFQGQGFMADGTASQVVEGVYLFWLRVPYGEVDTILTAAYPGTNSQLSTTGIGPDSYSAEIIGPNLPPAGAPTNPITF